MEKTSASCCVTRGDGASDRLPAWATRNRLMLAGGAVIVGGMAINWGWLTAIGVAPILLAMAPCAVMCGLGMCKTGTKKSSDAPASTPAVGETPSLAANTTAAIQPRVLEQ